MLTGMCAVRSADFKTCPFHSLEIQKRKCDTNWASTLGRAWTTLDDEMHLQQWQPAGVMISVGSSRQPRAESCAARAEKSQRMAGKSTFWVSSKSTGSGGSVDRQETAARKHFVNLSRSIGELSDQIEITVLNTIYESLTFLRRHGDLSKVPDLLR
jgi:hypothetical protein